MTLSKPAVLANYGVSKPQERAALTRGGDVAVNAGAGTGKTRTLVARYLSLLAEEGVALRGIVAVTFTRKAAREMRNRVRGEIGRYLKEDGLSEAEREKWRAAYTGLDAARIGTIHNLCGEILRSHPAELGIDPRFEVLDERQSALLQKEVVEETLAWAVATEETAGLLLLWREKELTALIELLLTDRLAVAEGLAACPPAEAYERWAGVLAERQREALGALLAREDVKEWKRFLSRTVPTNDKDKMAYWRDWVLLSFKELESDNLHEQLRGAERWGEIKVVGGSKNSWSGGADELAAVKDVLKGLREVGNGEAGLLGLRLNEVDKRLAAAMPAVAALFKYVVRRYDEKKSELEALDFDDLEHLSLKLLRENGAVRAYWQEQIQAMLVDEFQDTNARQRAFIEQLCPEPGKLFIVGDAKQSIYAFRGANVAVFQEEQARIAAKKGEVIELDRSYRAHEPLLVAMNKMLAPVLGEGERPWEAAFAPLAAGEPGRDPKVAPPFVEFYVAKGNKGEGLPVAVGGVARRLVALAEGGRFDYGQMAILCRTSSGFAYYEDVLDKAGVPYVTVSGKGFYERPEVRDVLGALGALADPHDDIALVSFLRSPVIGLAEQTIQRLVVGRKKGESLWQTFDIDWEGILIEEAAGWRLAYELLTEVAPQAGRRRVADICEQFLQKSGYRAFLRAAGETRALRNVDKLLRDIHTSGLVDIDQYLESVGLWRTSGSREGEARATVGGAVQIMTIHASKGLEFPVVVLGDAGSGGKGRPPATFLIDDELGVVCGQVTKEEETAGSYLLAAERAAAQAEAERARLLYVAVTRAEEMLLVNGHVKETSKGNLSWGGWLGTLAEVTELVGQDFDGDEEIVWVWEGVEMRAVMAREEMVGVDKVVGAGVSEPELLVDGWPLLRRVTERAGETEESAERSLRVWEVVPRQARPYAPAWVIGSLVHEALAWWRFPQEEGFRPWLLARVRQYGLADAGQVEAAERVTVDLLRRFRGSDFYGEIDGADERWSEVPFAHEVGGRVVTGYIDLLYRAGDAWTIVDFKTDFWRDEADLRRILAGGDYEEQMARYGVAVERLLGVKGRKVLCWLNGGEGGVRVMVV
ncbi:MAG TPA: UvrD-helicase domain-containing protein [Anaerolineae bacterium]|nr:UvrD-helicase domain-containing protein [Anaerolineae bacterium]